MAKPYDASIKQMVEAHPADWLAVAGLPVTGVIDVIDSDVSSISPVWAATKLLLGLRYSAPAANELLQGVNAMTIDLRDSSVYQEILKEGLVEGQLKGKLEGKIEGKIEGVREMLLRQGEHRFGPPPANATAAIMSVTDLSRIQALADRVLDVIGWDELLRE